MRNTKVYSITMPPAMAKQAERLAKRENRTMSELMREAFRRYQQEEQRPSPEALKNLGQVIRLIQQEAKRTGLDKMTKREINTEIAAARKDMQMKQGKKPANRPSK